MPSDEEGVDRTGVRASLNLLTNTKPVDRLRFQAHLLFNYLDQRRRGSLSSEDMGRYVEYCNERFGSGRFNLDNLYTPLLVQGTDVAFEDFEALFRQQVAMLSTPAFVESQLKGPEVGKLLYKCAVSVKELAKALAIFKLLDFDNDGFIALSEYSQVQGIEKKVFQDILSEADENEDGFLSFEDFMASYSRDRPVFLSLGIMAAHTVVLWLIFNSPLDTLFKAVLAGLLLLRPAIVTNPVIKIWQIGTALINRVRAQSEVMQSSGTADL